MVRSWVLLVLSTVLAFAAAPELQRAENLYQETNYGAALQILAGLPQKDAAAYYLAGRCYYMQGDFRKATDYFHKAIEKAPGTSAYYHWLGRTYGRRAEIASLLTAPSMASKARQSLEKAVELDPGNLEAINDLIEYYLEAPGILGGGVDKAARLTQQLATLDPVEYHYAQARIAEKRKEFDTAEQQLRRAVEMSPMQVGRVIDLARFLAQLGRYQESDQAFNQAEKIAPDSPKLLFAKAKTYIESGRNLDKARELLKRYMQCQLTPDDPPREEAERLLKKVAG
jgi:tetratricopeptide (TPR) repeat protein